MIVALVTFFLACEAVGPNVPTVNEPPVAKNKPIVFKTLLIIKRKVDLHQPPFLCVESTLTDEDVRVVKAAFEDYTRIWVDQLTNGRVKWEGHTVVSDLPLRSVSGNRSCAACGAINLRRDIDQFAPIGRYDGIFVYFKHIDDATGYTLPRPFGLSIGPNQDANDAGQTCVNWAPTRLWTRDSETTEIFLHEWLHQLEAFYGSKGVVIPRGGLHGGQQHGYKSEPGWKKWYGDFLNGNVVEDGKATGLGESAWRLGTIRDEARQLPRPKHSPAPIVAPVHRDLERARLTPKYLTEQRRKGNLLRNGSFDNDVLGPWKLWSWQNNQNAATLATDAPHDGPKCLRLVSKGHEDAHVSQHVEVKPFSNYLFCGWVRTEGIKIVEEGGTLGANLSISSGEHSRSIESTSDWQYVVVMFYTVDKREIDVQARIGSSGSTVDGEACFDDLCLIEVPQMEAARIPK